MHLRTLNGVQRRVGEREPEPEPRIFLRCIREVRALEIEGDWQPPPRRQNPSRGTVPQTTCRGLTKKNKRCRRRETPYCYQHVPPPQPPNPPCTVRGARNPPRGVQRPWPPMPQPRPALCRRELFPSTSKN